MTAISQPPFALSTTAVVVLGVAAAAAVLLLALWLRERQVSQARDTRRTDKIDRELEAVASLSTRLARARDVRSVAELLVDEVVTLLGLDFVAVALVDEEANEAAGLVARDARRDAGWWSDMRWNLAEERSITAAVVSGRELLAIADLDDEPNTNRRLAERVGAKSAVFAPVIAENRVQAVLIGAVRGARREFGGEELALLQALAAEAALALERTISAAALADALERERLVAGIGRRVRSELDLDAVLRVAVEELAQAIGVMRAFIRLGEAGEAMPVLAEWTAPGAAPVGNAAPHLPVLNLAARERRTIAVADLETSPELADPALGSVDLLRELGARSVLATPIVVFDRMIGVFGLHRDTAGSWGAEEIALVEAVAREAGLAIHTARLLDEDRRRFEQQAALLEAAAAVTRELRVETVFERLVAELTKLVRADAADLYVYDVQRGALRCVAVHGLDENVVGLETEPTAGVSGQAVEAGRAVRADAYDTLEHPVQHPAYRGFRAAMAAPLVWSGEARGVVGVGSRDPARRFTELDTQIVETFAGLAALALANAESFERSERQARVERGFYRIAALLGEPLSLAQTFEAVAHAACEAFAGSFAAALTPGFEGLEVAGRHEVEMDAAAALARELGGAEAVGGALRAGRRLTATSLLDDERFPESFRALAAREGYRSLLLIPCELPRRAERGVVVVAFRDERVFSDDDLELAGHLGGAARGALERSELYERERTSRALAQHLARTGSLLAAELDPSVVLAELAEQAPPLLGVDAAAIRVLEGEELVVAAVAGVAGDSAGSRTAVAGTPSGDVVQSRAPLAFTDTVTAGLDPDDDALLAVGHRAYLGVPLRAAEGDVRGALAVYAHEPREWREEEVEALVALAGNAGAVLANAELYQRVALEKERSDAVIANVADGIVAVDRDGTVVLWNRAAEQITGLPQSEALGRPLVRLLGRNLSAAPGGAERLVPIPRGAEQVWLSVSEAVMRDPAGDVAGRIYAFRDVSAERVVEEMKSTFVSTVSEELRRPLTSIYGFAETLLRRDVLFSEDERRTFLGYIASEAERLTSIVDQLLSVARLEAGDLDVELAPTDVRRVVAEVVETVEASGALDGHRFVIDLPSEPLDASVDRDKLRQILVNLVDNAVKFSPGGGTVTVAARRRPDAVEVRVVDEGVGVPAGEHDRIFSKFHRADSPVTGGTGLGLFIAQGLVTAMGGRIWVDSQAGEGATFVFELPVARGRSLAVAE
ncbi:MAG: GAF domain-containing protein [Thermoleophilia bacterium]|nr:GAF domain-containing protein [Thermoleophilia bacterium]